MVLATPGPLLTPPPSSSPPKTPFRSYSYSPYTFPDDATLRYEAQGSAKDLETKEAAAVAEAAAAAAVAAAAAAAAEEARNAFRPPPGIYDAWEWLIQYRFNRQVASNVCGEVIERFRRKDVWTLLNVDIDSLDLADPWKRQLRRAAEGLRKAWEDGAMAEDGTLSASAHCPRLFTRPQPGTYEVYSWLSACGVPGVEANDIKRKIVDRSHNFDVWGLLELSAGDIDSMDLTLWQKTLLRRGAAALQEAKDAGVMAEDGTLVEAGR